MSHKFGWRRDLPDHRDHLYSAPLEGITVLPSSIDLRPQCPPVYDQQSLGSCTAQAIAAAIEFDRKKQGLPDFVPSRLFVYYNERAMEGTVNSDAGAAIRDGIKAVNKKGACNETEWPYDISQFTVKPSDQCYKDALLDRALKYQSVSHNLNQMKGCLASGYPFVFGFTVYDSFESDTVAQTGIVPMPQPDEQVLGGHAVVAVGYNDAQQVFIVRNSWSAQWGDKGYCYMPYAYLTNPHLASDFWVIRLVS
jgi:C1A family cysteine protease